MFIERFFNPTVSSCEQSFISLPLKEALVAAKTHGAFIRHYSFKGFQYIRYDDKLGFIWYDGSQVDLRKIPRKSGYAKFYSNLYNYESF